MMVYEMNVGLFVGNNHTHPENTWGQIKRREGEIRSYLFGQVSGKARFHPGEEPTLVVQFLCKGDVEAKQIAERVAIAWEQDCVALRNGLSGRGWLVGPNASAWGDYQEELFVRYSND